MCEGAIERERDKGKWRQAYWNELKLGTKADERKLVRVCALCMLYVQGVCIST